ncbi:MAG: pitrilysin family protein [Vicinamibacterales bacterium]|nr:pitrilysin family protein [Vicinamibacterales bacterium]
MTAVDRTRLPEVGDDPAFRFPEVQRHRLANGLDVRTIEHGPLPVVTFVLLVRDGMGSDPAGREGLAALTADLLDEGTGDWSAIEVSDALARIGADYGVDVRDDATVQTLTTLSRFAGRGASLLASLTLRPSLREADIDRVRTQRLNRLKQLKDSPAARGEQAFLRAVYGTHPYGHLSIGHTAALQAVSPEDIALFHRSAFRPDRATLVVAGDGGHDTLLRLAEDAFAEWAPSATRTLGDDPAGLAPPSAPSTRLGLVHREQAAQSILLIGQLAPPRSTPDYAPLVVLNAALGGQFVSRINLKLREEKGYTYGARTGFDWRKGPGTFSLEASVETRVTGEAITDALGELKAIQGERPVTPAELDLAKASLTRGYSRNFETAGQVARSVAQLALYDLPDAYFEEFVPKARAVTGDDVTRVAHQHLDPAMLTTVVVGDRVAIGDTLAGLGLGVPSELGTED